MIGDKCGFCGGETDTGMNCIAGCENIRPAKIVYVDRGEPTPCDIPACARCEARDELFEELVAEIRHNLHGPDCCDDCERRHAILAKIDAYRKGVA